MLLEKKGRLMTGIGIVAVVAVVAFSLASALNANK